MRISFLSTVTLHLLLQYDGIGKSLAEIRAFEGPIEASANFIHYSEGFIVTPGYVDISDLAFTSDDNGHETSSNDDDTDDGGDNADDVEQASHSNSIEGDDGGRGRNLAALSNQYSVEIALFHEPKNCTVDGGLCDWAELGVGAEDELGDLRWCCWEDAIDLGLCKGDPGEYGKLILNNTKFRGLYRSIAIPPTGDQVSHVKFGKMAVEGESGKYVMLVSNCNPEGRNMYVSGKYVWKSQHGYLPGDLFGEMYFNFSLTVIYTVLFIVYLVYMKIHKDSRIPIQNYILLTIGIGFFEVFFKAGDYWVWNIDGTRFWFALYTGLLIGVLKRAISRCLVVMVCLGWGVVRDNLDDHMRKIYILGGLYAVTSALCEVLRTLRIVENEIIGVQEEEEIVDITAVLTFVVAAIDVIFYMWILDSLSGTMQYLENMNQSIKLQRYLRLRLVLLLSILFAVSWAIFGLVNNFMTVRMLEEKHEWGVQGAWEVNYFMVLASLSFLWKPDASAKEYAFVMELPSMPNDDVNFATNADCDDEDDADTNDEKESSLALKIDDAVDA